VDIAAAQREVRTVYRGGFYGQLVSGVLWLASAAAGVWGSERLAIVILIAGGFFIFPATTLLLRAAGGRSSLGSGHPMNGLAMQVAFTLPLVLPIVGAAALYRLNWFYPAFMVALGAHYLPFVVLYGMRMFALLCAVLVGGGIALALYGPDSFTLGGWVTGVVLLIAAFVGKASVEREERG
jgi:hypothetical protein